MLEWGHVYGCKFTGNDIYGKTGEEINQYIINTCGLQNELELIRVSFNGIMSSAILLPNHDLSQTGTRRVAIIQSGVAYDAVPSASSPLAGYIPYYIGFVTSDGQGGWAFNTKINLTSVCYLEYTKKDGSTGRSWFATNTTTRIYFVKDNTPTYYGTGYKNYFQIYTLPNEKGYLIGMDGTSIKAASSDYDFDGIITEYLTCPNTLIYEVHSVRHDHPVQAIISTMGSGTGDYGIVVDDYGLTWDEKSIKKYSYVNCHENYPRANGMCPLSSKVTVFEKYVCGEYYADDLYYCKNDTSIQATFGNFMMIYNFSGNPAFAKLVHGNDRYIVLTTASTGKEYIAIKVTWEDE